jgi:predicted nucleic acid-binding protein
VNTVVCDASVLVKWVKADRERETEAAQAILAARTRADLRIAVLDLVFYEVGNTLTFKSDMPGHEVADRLDDLQFLCNDILPLNVALRRRAAVFAADHRLSFYDAAHASLARAVKAPLVTADAELIQAGAGVSPTEFAASL